MNLGHVIALDPTVKQANAFARACGVARFTYNWALAEWTKQHAAGEKPNANALKKQWNAIKGGQFPWVLESPRDANSQPFADLGRAFSNFFASCKGARKGKRVGYPAFKKKGDHDAFYVANDKFTMRARGKRGVVRLPVIGDVRTQEPLRWQGKILSGRVFRKADRWFLAVAVDVSPAVADRTATNADVRRPVVGVDLGLKTAVVCSDGATFNAPKPLRAALRRLKRANCKLHRRVKGSNNRRKARVAVARIHLRVANIRKDFWQKLTTNLVRENQTIVIEDLNMSFMLRNRRLARAASDVALGMFRPMLAYKASLHDCEIVVADKFYSSTQRCSSCGAIRTGDEKIILGESEYACENCGVVEDRDLNASFNLEQYPTLIAGNWRRVPRTPAETAASTRRPNRASAVVEAGTKQCAFMRTD